MRKNVQIFNVNSKADVHVDVAYFNGLVPGFSSLLATIARHGFPISK